jgi:hypothetical protein
MKKYTAIKLCILFVVLVAPSLIQAQPGFDEDIMDTPIDGGLSLLVAAGVGYGAKKLKDNKRRENKQY